MTNAVRLLLLARCPPLLLLVLRLRRRVLAGPRLRATRAWRTLLHVLPRRLVGGIHALATAVLHSAHGRELHVGLHLAAGLTQLRGGRVRRVLLLLLGLGGVATIAGLTGLGALRPHLARLVVVAGSTADAAS